MSHLRWYASAALFVAIVPILGTGYVLCFLSELGELLIELAESIGDKIIDGIEA